MTLAYLGNTLLYPIMYWQENKMIANFLILEHIIGGINDID